MSIGKANGAWLIVVVMMVSFFAAPLAAADPPDEPPVAVLVPTAPITPTEAHLGPTDGSHRPFVLLPLYASYIALQAVDVHTTLDSLHHGARELNPLVGRTTSSPAA